MPPLDADIAECRVLVVDGNATSRSIIISQLRDFGVLDIAQASRPTDARRALEHKEFDVVLCEQRFPDSSYTGQALLDDLRRAQLLPLATVFVMLTGEASYAQVAEAAESALDSYLLKPHTASALGQRLRQARHRKRLLHPIFSAIAQGSYEAAAHLCVERFQQRAPYWLYAARIGAELMLRLGRANDAQALFETIHAHQALPWAKLGVARSQIESNQGAQAMTTLESLAASEPTYADAYDIMGRLHTEQGNFEQALVVYRQASAITPSSIARLQKQGMLAFYLGEKLEAAKALDRATLLGLTSKLFDHQSLMLLAFSRFQLRDTQGIKRCVEQLQTAMDQRDAPLRLRRFMGVAQTLLSLANKHLAVVVTQLQEQANDITSPAFDMEAACNLLSLLAEVARLELRLDAAPDWITTMGERFCTSKGTAELLAGACQAHPPYAELVRAAHRRVGELAQQAMVHAVAGQPDKAVMALVAHGGQTLNTRLMETARLTLQRHRAAIAQAQTLDGLIQYQLDHYAPSGQAPALGQPPGRSAGGLSLLTAAEQASASR
jgi:CheY-like chemotaxis protein